MVPTDGGDANLSLFLGGAAANHTDEDFPPGCILHKMTQGSGSSRRLYVSKKYTNTKGSIDLFKKVIQESAMRSNVALNAGLRNEKRANKTYQRIYFYCPHKKNCNCKMHFTLNYDPEMSRWYLIAGSGHPEHTPHERGQPPRKNAKRKLTQVALEQQGLASSDFGGDAATQNIVTAAAVAAFKPKTKESGEGTCFLCHPFVMGKPNEVLVTCACDSFESNHFWLGPIPDAVSNESDSGINSTPENDLDDDEEEDASSDSTKSDSGNDEDFVLTPKIKPTPPPVEEGLDRRTKRIDKEVAKMFNESLSFFDKQITKPDKALKKEGNGANRLVSFSGYAAYSTFGSRADPSDSVMQRKGIMSAGKNVFAGRWVEDSENQYYGSSSKYYTLLIRDPNREGDVGKTGICSIYFRPLENTGYWWLSYLSTVEGSATERKGYGTMIMWRMINLARRAEDVREIWLEVDPDLEGVQKLYQTLGFEEVPWDKLPSGISNYEMVYPDVGDPQKTKRERVYKHQGKFVLMRLNLSIFPPLTGRS